jgi:SAM-dependent methyltransferase
MKPLPSSAPDFNRLANLYRWMEYFSFGPFLCLARSAFLPRLGACRRALVLGDGDGRFTAGLLRLNRCIEVDAVDASDAMLQALLRRAGMHAARVHAHLADARAWVPTAPCDLIVTHFFLDCLTTDEVAALALRLRPAAAPNALWVVSEFAVPEGWFGRLLAGPLVAALYLAFGLLTGLSVRRLPDHSTALRQAGFVLEERHWRLGGLLQSELWRAVSSDSGANPCQASESPIEMLQTC